MPRESGFTLVEVAIVLVVVGLIIGGVLAGGTLLRSSELRAAANEFHKHNAALLIFKDKYGKLPGDMRNATEYWGSGGGDGLITTGACRSVAVTGLGDNGTCNGDGNGRIGNADTPGGGMSVT